MPIENNFNWVYHLPNDKPFLEGYGMEWFTKLEIQNWSTSPALYMRRVGPYGPENRVLMETFKQWLRTHDLFTADCVIVAAALDNPMQIKPVDCRYDICFLCSESVAKKFSAEIACKQLNGGRYAVFQIKHTVEAIQKAWNECFAYLLTHDYRPNLQRPVLERYQKQMVDNYLCELCIPIQD